MAHTEHFQMVPARPLNRLQRFVEAVRSYTIGPINPRDKTLARYFGGGGGSKAGIAVSEDSALACSSVWCALTLVGDDIASLPLNLYKRLPDGGKDRYEQHPLYRLLHDAPNPEMTSMVLRRTLQVHAMLWGNGYAEIERDIAGRPVAFWPLTPDRASLIRTPSGDLAVRYQNMDGQPVILPYRDVIHIPSLSFDGGEGYRIIGKARESIALSLAAEAFGSSFFGNGATFGGVVMVPTARPTDQSDESYRKQLELRHQGVERAHKLLMLYNGAKFEKTGTAPNEAQFTETRLHQVREIARWWKIPPHKLGDLADATYSNVEQMEAAYYNSCLRPWVTLWNQELTRKLISPLERNLQFIEHETKGLLAADAEGRSALYTAQHSVGAITSNEIRGLENMDPIAGGDQAFVQMNLIPLSLATKYAEAQIDKLVADAESTRKPKTEPVPPTQDQVNALMEPIDKRLAAQVEAVRAQLDLVKSEVEQRIAAEALLEDARRANATLTAASGEKDRALEAKDFQIRILIAEKQTAERETEDGREARAQVTAKTAELATALQERTALLQEKQAIELEKVTAVEAQEQAERTVQQLTESAAALTALVAEREQQIEALAREKAAGEAVLAELRTHIQPMTEKLVASEAARALAEVKAAERDEAVRVAESRQAEIHALTTATTSRLEQIAAAQRTNLVEALNRVIQTEVDRARKAQATPEKLRAWTETFYETYTDRCRRSLRGAVIGWAACAGVDADRALSLIVRDHIDRSRRELRDVLDADDPEQLAADLARTLLRWETERADTVADRLMAEGERYGH